MLNYDLKIGLLPVRRYIKEPPKRIGIFQSDYAVENKRRCVAYIKEHFSDAQTQFVDIDFLNEEGLLYLDADSDKVVDYFRAQNIDALFIVNCNFGNENAAGAVAKRLGLPTLLWGPRDTHFENGIRYTDTQCGLFAISKQLKRAHVPFSYINNCDVEAEKFADGLRSFCSVATMLRNFRDLRVVQVGTRVAPFRSIMYNELELAERFGIEVECVNLADAVAELTRIYEENGPALEADLVRLKETFDCGKLDDVYLKKMLAVVHYYRALAARYDCNIISAECWTGITSGWGANPCLAMCLLAAENIFVTCEWDMHMTITNVLLFSASRGKAKPIQGEFTTRNPENENSELLWHCGPFPLEYKADDGKKPYLYNTKPSFRLRDGEYTIARFQCEEGRYSLLGGKFETCAGPETFGTYLWAQFKDLDAVERKLIEGPYIHHMSEVPGDYVRELKEFARLRGIAYDAIEE